MIFWGSLSDSVEGTTVSAPGASAEGAARAGASFLGGVISAEAVASGVARMREIGGKNERLPAPSASVRFGRGFFSSINDKVSMTGFGAGLGMSLAFGEGSEWARAFGAGTEGAARNCFSGVSTLALFVSLLFGC